MPPPPKDMPGGPPNPPAGGWAIDGEQIHPHAANTAKAPVRVFAQTPPTLGREEFAA